MSCSRGGHCKPQPRSPGENIRDRINLGAQGEARDSTRTDIVTIGGAIALSLVLGVLLAQRTSLRARTLVSQIAAIAACSATVGMVAGITAAITVAIVTPLAHLLRRIFDGRRLAASGP